MSESLTFDLDAVTPRMLVDFKTKTGANLMGLVGEDLDLEALEPEILTGFIWLALRMSGKPASTWDDALDTPLASLTFADEDEAETDPTSAS